MAGGERRQPYGDGDGRDDLAEELSDFARALAREDDPETALRRVVDGAIALIPGVEEGSITVVVERRKANSEAASSDLPRDVDALQHEVGEGPCLDAVYDEKTVRVDDMASEARWPDFARRAAEAGVGSMLTFQLWVEGDNLGALNLYSGRPHAFDEESEHIGLLYAAHAAVAYFAAQRQDQLQTAVDTRDLIGQAKGILMERYGIDGDRAFAFMTRLSMDRNQKLRDIAQHIVTGTLRRAESDD
jgi:GAF domain-containing protein